MWSCTDWGRNRSTFHKPKVSNIFCLVHEENYLIYFYCRAQHVEVLQLFGMTEAAGLVFAIHRLYPNYSSIGWPAAMTEAKVVNYNDPLFLGQEAYVSGEILVRSPSIELEYLNNPEETAKSLANGWLRTGDIGYYDNNGDFYITDRSKDMIKVKGNQVAPAELEEILLAHPKVLDAAVIGVTHERFGEAPKAFVVVRQGSVLTELEIQEYIKGRCAKYKWLVGGVKFIADVPKSKTGKIMRRELRDMNEK